MKLKYKKVLILLIVLLGLLIVARSVFKIPAFGYDVKYTGNLFIEQGGTTSQDIF